jgi:hypothetical protein
MLDRSENGLEQFSVVALTPNTFRFLGVPALLGRAFGEEDAKPGALPVAVLSYKTWIGYFGGDPGILSRTISLNDTPLTVSDAPALHMERRGRMGSRSRGPPRSERHEQGILAAGMPEKGPRARRRRLGSK